MRLKTLAAVLAGAAFSPVLSATPSPAPLPVQSLDPVVVTATRMKQPITDTLAPVTVIDRDDIDRLQPKTLNELLSGRAGINVSNSGGMGQQTSLFMRGTSPGHTLILVDGIRVSSVTSGAAALNDLPVDQIERIEIVRGPRSSLYGADAVGGVIQIFTRHADAEDALQPSLRISGGSHNTWDAQVGLSGGSEHAWFNASLGSQYTRGIDSCRQGAGVRFVGCFTNEPDRDGYRAYNALLNGGYEWDNGVKLSAQFLRNTGFVEYDGSLQNQGRTGQQVEGVKLRIPATDVWQTTLKVGRNLDKTTSYLNDVYVGRFDSERDQVSWLNTFIFTEDQRLNAGIDWERQHISSDTSYTSTSRTDTGVFAQYQGHFGAQELQLSVRQDHNEQFGDHTTGAVAWGYHFSDALVLSASWASSFHAPAFNDLFWPTMPGLPPSSDPDLEPETSHNVEIDLAARHESWHWQASVYRNTIDDLIQLDANFTPGNISKARITGFDGEVGGQLRDWTWQADLTWQKPENAAGGANDGNLLPRRTERSVRFDLDRQFGDFSLGASFKAFSHRYDDLANTRRMGGYALVDLRGSWTFAPHWEVQASVDNLFDRDYETVYYYNQPGRTGMLTLRYRP